MQKSKSNILLVSLFLAVIAVIIFVTVMLRFNHSSEPTYSIASNLKIDGTILDKPRIIDDFKLIADNNEVFTQKNLKNHWTLLFFGFTSCGYVCPTTLAALNKMYKHLNVRLTKNLLPMIVMVSLDPARDSVERLHQYIKTFNPHFVGVRGTIQQTEHLAEQMSVVFSKIKTDNGDYTINHSAEILVFDPNGNLRAFFAFPHDGKQMAMDYEAIIQTVKK